ncbi:hypothetical protein WJX81_006817 [Elliptochloris bilobata]|uniref:Rhodanese domain-containing protein n=1 Tax=Elliptochloris bilobata TaxID=381761 RepID=A0AAW1SJQ4_9CHLO
MARVITGTPVLKASPLAAKFQGRNLNRTPFSRVVTAVAQRKAVPAKKEPQGLLNGALSTAALALLVAPARAQSEAAVSTTAVSAVDSAVNALIDIIKAAGSSVKAGVDTATVGLEYAKNALSQATPVVKDAADTVAPYVRAGLQTAGDVAAPALKAAEPVVQGSIGEVERFLEAQGLNARALLDGARQATSTTGEVLETARPTVDSTVSTVSSTLATTDPVVLAEYAAGLVALYYLGPPLLKGIFGSLRGYAGNISPAAALDAVSNDGNTLLIDIRTEREKEAGGLPDLPNSGRLVELEYAVIEDRKVRSLLRNVSAIEQQVTVLQIAALKKVSKGTRMLLLDRNGSGAKAIARELSRRGFKKVFVVQGGFSGWTAAKLQTKLSSSVSSVEVLSPSSLFGTMRQSANGKTSRRSLQLPSGR